MSALYLHIPFCRTRCIYCDFYSGVDLSLQERYVDALVAEAAMRAGECGEEVRTLYLGGGTPSLLPVPLLRRLLDGVGKVTDLHGCTELTIECNPDDLTPIYIGQLAELPFNRISMGVQSFDDERLAFLCRRHTGREAAEAVRRCQNAGYTNISIDLIYGLPQQSIDEWQHDIDCAIGLGIQHISAYALTYEEGTRLYALRERGVVAECDEELQRAMYDLLIDRLAAAGYVQYEISNFALPGYHSRHNSSYWQDIPYLGLGASAHSYDRVTRRYNPRDTRRYIDAIEAGHCCHEEERLTADDRYNDMLLTRLRTRRGLDCKAVEATFGTEAARYLRDCAAPYVRRGLMEYADQHLRITRQGIFVSDGIISDLFHLGDED